MSSNHVVLSVKRQRGFVSESNAYSGSGLSRGMIYLPEEVTRLLFMNELDAPLSMSIVVNKAST